MIKSSFSRENTMRNLIILALALFTVASLAGQFLAPKEAQKWMKAENAVLLDVRETGELKAGGMALGAKWIPMSAIKSNSKEWTNFQKRLSKSQKVIIYCASGGRAGRVESSLKEKGIKAFNMGGFRDWKAAGLPITQLKE